MKFLAHPRYGHAVHSIDKGGPNGGEPMVVFASRGLAIAAVRNCCVRLFGSCSAANESARALYPDNRLISSDGA